LHAPGSDPSLDDYYPSNLYDPFERLGPLKTASRRSRAFKPRWTSAQLGAGVVLALIAGLAIGYGGRAGTDSSPSSTIAALPRHAATSSVPTVKADTEPPLLDLPPEPAAARTLTPQTTALPSVAPAPTVAVATPTTTAVSTPPTLASGGAAPQSAAGSERVLLNVRSSGSRRTQSFTVAPGGWKLGWGFDCSRASDQTFAVKVLGSDATPGQETAVARSGAKGSGVEHYETTGERMLEVTTTCVWEVKVVGVA
jgi:hypothetical protein